MYRGDDDKCNGCGCDPCIGSKCPGRTNGFRVRRLTVLGSVVVAGGIALTGAGCIPPDPCLAVPPPSADLIKVSTQYDNIEIDYVVDDHTECDLINGRWQRESQ